MEVRRAASALRISALESMYPSELAVVGPRSEVVGVKLGTTYGYVLDGTAQVRLDGALFHLEVGFVFAAPDTFDVETDGRVVLITRHGFRGVVGATKLEREGRLAYIDGCSDSVLFAPPRLGDPVLNHLHFPARTTQTRHAHPSVRLGVVARGSGVAEGIGWEEPLVVGSVFRIDAHEVHAFRTGDESMDVVAFHPDSDWGPTDGVHPMKNRTFVV